MRVLAVDGGQSAIRVRHSAGDAGAEVPGVSRQEGDVVAAVAAAVVTGWRAAGAHPVDRAVLGLTTAPSDAASRDRLCAAVAAGTGAAEVWLADDAVTTHAGALSLGWGVSVTAGTGVACLAMPRVGAPRIIGGHGFLLGDEGGAFWIGREGLRAVLRAGDGRGAPTDLAGAAAARFGGLADLSERLHAVSRPVNDIAHFAPDVVAAADAGDPAAVAIVDGAIDELVTLVRAGVAAVARGVAAAGGQGAAAANGVTAAEGAAVAGGVAGGQDAANGVTAAGGVVAAARTAVPVALGGRLLLPGSSLRVRLDAALARSILDAAPRDADGDPLDGAMRLGLAPDPGRYRSFISTWRGQS